MRLSVGSAGWSAARGIRECILMHAVPRFVDLPDYSFVSTTWKRSRATNNSCSNTAHRTSTTSDRTLQVYTCAGTDGLQRRRMQGRRVRSGGMCCELQRHVRDQNPTPPASHVSPLAGFHRSTFAKVTLPRRHGDASSSRIYALACRQTLLIVSMPRTSWSHCCVP